MLVLRKAGGPNPAADSEHFADERLRFVEWSGGDLASALNAGVAAAAGEYVTFLGVRDTLTPRAVDAVLETVTRSPGTSIFYSDERSLGGSHDIMKPVFSPERLRSQFYFGNLTAYRRELIVSLEGIRSGFDGAELYDLALRASVSGGVVEHLREALYSPGSDAGGAWGTGQFPETAIREVLKEHLERTGGGRVESVHSSGVFRTHRPVEGEPLVSIVIPTRGGIAEVRGIERCMVIEAVRSVVELSTYENYEFVIVIDDGAPESVYSDLRTLAGDRLTFVQWSQPFSFSAKMNLGVLHASGDYVLLLNDDVEVITPGWIEAMLALAQRPGAGLVGSMLYFEDDTIQHAGHAYYKTDVTHIGLNSERGSVGPGGGFLVEREVDGVTAACAMVSREVFLEAGGFSTLLPGNFNDVDLCMKVSVLGYQSIWTPYAELYHFESKSRDPRVAAYEIRTAWGRWEHRFYDSDYWPDDPHILYKREEQSGAW